MKRSGIVGIFRFSGVLFGVLAGCSILATRPVQEMSDTWAAMRAAKEAQADTLAPELYRRAAEWFFRAKNEYKLKNFMLASEYAEKARLLAEQAEFESVQGNMGANRRTTPVPPPPPDEPTASPPGTTSEGKSGSGPENRESMTPPVAPSPSAPEPQLLPAPEASSIPSPSPSNLPGNSSTPELTPKDGQGSQSSPPPEMPQLEPTLPGDGVKQP